MAANTSPMNTYMTFLMYKPSAGSDYSELLPIKDYPDFLNDINTIDVTNLEQSMHTYILGLADTGGDMTFTANYIKSDYSAVKALEGSIQDVALWFGGTVSNTTVTPTGDDGKWSFKGYIKAGIVGKGVDEAREMQIHVAPTTDMTFA